MKNIISLVCVAALLFSSSAFAYKRDVQRQKTTTEETSTEPATQKGQQYDQGDYEYNYEPKGRGTMILGYTLIGLGGAAAIAGSTIAVASDKRLAGAIVGATGAALGLAGSLMIMIGSRHYALTPAVDPTHGTYGLAMSTNF